jgi:hypothetical protein
MTDESGCWFHICLFRVSSITVPSRYFQPSQYTQGMSTPPNEDEIRPKKVARIKEGSPEKADLRPVLPEAAINQSLEDRSDDAEQLIKSVLASHDIVQLRKHLEYDESAKYSEAA